MRAIKKTLLIIITIITVGNLFAQESKSKFDIGVDFASRYVWRGMQFSDSPSIQPFMEFSTGNFTLGAWASYDTGKNETGFTQEFDLYASYSIGALTLGFTDYSFPIDGFANSDGYFMMKNHIGEVTISFNGIDSFPLTAMVGVNVYNDDDNSIYTEIGYPFSIGETEMSAFLGLGNKIYSTDSEYQITNFGLSASKDVKITDSFSLGVSASALFNPDTDDAYLVFILSM